MVRLEPRSAAILGQLRDADSEIVTRQELLDGAWGSARGSDEALTQAVAQIRRGFEEIGIHDAIETLAKRGYRLRVRLADQCGIARPTSPRTSLIIGGLILALMLALSFAHPIRHAVRHALGLGPPAQSTGAPDHAS